MTSITSFNEKTEADEVVTAFSDSIKGKTILITGVSPNGLGEAFAKSVARHEPALLILTGRTVQKVEAVVAQFSVQVPTRIVKLDVASFPSIRNAVEEIKSFAEHIDILVNNAGVMNVPERRLSEDGFEMHLAVNHLGPFLLTTGLTPLLTASKGSRIVNVGSNGYAFSPFRFTDYNFDGNPIPEAEQPSKDLCKQYGLPWTLEYTPTIAYGQSKTAIMLFTVQLAKLYNSKGITAICVHPGAIATELWRHMDNEITQQTFTMLPMKSLSQGVSTALVAALDPKLSNSSGTYMEDCQLASLLDFAQDASSAEKLWTLSQKLSAEEPSS